MQNRFPIRVLILAILVAVVLAVLLAIAAAVLHELSGAHLLNDASVL